MTSTELISTNKELEKLKAKVEPMRNKCVKETDALLLSTIAFLHEVVDPQLLIFQPEKGKAIKHKFAVNINHSNISIFIKPDNDKSVEHFCDFNSYNHWIGNGNYKMKYSFKKYRSIELTDDPSSIFEFNLFVGISKIFTDNDFKFQMASFVIEYKNIGDKINKIHNQIDELEKKINAHDELIRQSQLEALIFVGSEIIVEDTPGQSAIIGRRAMNRRYMGFGRNSIAFNEIHVVHITPKKVHVEFKVYASEEKNTYTTKAKKYNKDDFLTVLKNNKDNKLNNNP